jgi:hypothetical protein
MNERTVVVSGTYRLAVVGRPSRATNDTAFHIMDRDRLMGIELLRATIHRYDADTKHDTKTCKMKLMNRYDIDSEPIYFQAFDQMKITRIMHRRPLAPN